MMDCENDGTDKFKVIFAMQKKGEDVEYMHKPHSRIPYVVDAERPDGDNTPFSEIIHKNVIDALNIGVPDMKSKSMLSCLKCDVDKKPICYVLYMLNEKQADRLRSKLEFKNLENFDSSNWKSEGHVAGLKEILSGRFKQSPSGNKKNQLVTGAALLSLLIAGGGYLYNRYRKGPLPEIHFDTESKRLPFIPSASIIGYGDKSNKKSTASKNASAVRTVFKSFPSGEINSNFEVYLNQLYANRKALFPSSISTSIKTVKNHKNFINTMTKLTVITLFTVHRVGLKKLKGDKEATDLLRAAHNFWTVTMKKAQFDDFIRTDLVDQLRNTLARI
jgi:hypothetical protein